MKFASSALSVLSASTLLLSGANAAIDLDINSPASIAKAAGVAADGLRQWYTGDRPGDVPGNLPAPYYWWEAGAVFGAFIDYWYYTGDSQYNNITFQAMQHQIGDFDAFEPKNQSKSLGNDDQAFWGMAAMSAAENKLEDLPTEGALAGPSWLSLAQAVFNRQAARWNKTNTCGGGLNWQIFEFNNGFTYRNTISNGCFFNIAARLYKYTGNETYNTWAIKTWDWERAVNLMDEDLHFYDGTDETRNCTDINKIQWTYNLGVHLSGAAAMWNATQDDLWKTRIEQMVKTMQEVFFRDNVMYEVACELNGKCNNDQRSFKAYLARWMGYTMITAPWSKDSMWTMMTTSAKAAAAQCNAGKNGCGLRWYNNGANDGSFGPGEQMAAMEIIQNLLITNVSGPVTETKGGTSKSDPAAGGGEEQDPIVFDPITTGDKAGAGFLTTIVLIGILGGAWWMVAN